MILPFTNEEHDAPAGLIAPCHVSIVVAEARILFVRISAPWLQALIVSAHGLDSSYTKAEVKEYWRSMRSLIQKHRRLGERLLLGIDANCRIGKASSSEACIGNLLDDPRSTTHVTKEFTGFAADSRLIIASTHEEYADDSAIIGSFITCKGSVRCDYILTDEGTYISGKSARTLDNFMMNNKKADHRPVQLDVMLTYKMAPQQSLRRKPKYDRQAVRAARMSTDAMVQQQVRDLEVRMLSMQPIPFTVEPTTHRQLLADFMECILEDVFPLPPMCKIREFITQATFLLIQRRAVIRHALCSTRKKLASATEWFCFRTWAAIAVRRRGPKPSVAPITLCAATSSPSFPDRTPLLKYQYTNSLKEWYTRPGSHTYTWPYWSSVRGPATKNLCIKQFTLRNLTIGLTSDIRKAAKADFQEWVAARSRDIEEAALENDTRVLHQLLRRLKPYDGGRDFRIANPDGDPTTSAIDELTVIRDSFMQKLEGTSSTMEAIIQQDRLQALPNALRDAAVERDIKSIPSMPFLISRYSKAKVNGLGEVAIGGEVQKLVPRIYALLHHPLHTKVAFCIRLPVHW